MLKLKIKYNDLCNDLKKSIWKGVNDAIRLICKFTILSMIILIVFVVSQLININIDIDIKTMFFYLVSLLSN